MSALADLLLELPDLRCLRLAHNNISDISFEILARVSLPMPQSAHISGGHTSGGISRSQDNKVL